MGIFIDVHKKLGNFTLNIRFASEAKRIGILGASGCGKSMTLKSIVGIISPDAGTIRIGEQIVFDSGKKINLIPQKRKVAESSGRIFVPELCAFSEYDRRTKYCGRTFRKPGGKAETGAGDGREISVGRSGTTASGRTFRRAAAEDSTGADHGI